jgi:hypothetical protein
MSGFPLNETATRSEQIPRNTDFEAACNLVYTSGMRKMPITPIVITVNPSTMNASEMISGSGMSITGCVRLPTSATPRP